MIRRDFLKSSAVAAVAGPMAQAAVTAAVPDKVAVLTFDDAVKSQLTFVAPLLKELGFGATFFVTHEWMPDRERFMSWEEIGELYRMGFEIGNHTWTHAGVSMPRGVARLKGETYLVDQLLAQKAKVPPPVSFGYPGNGFGPEAVAKVAALGYRFARRGMQPEMAYGKIEPGPAYDPAGHHPLLIPTTGDSYPNGTLENFKRVAALAREGRIAVLQFHGVPDVAHPWVNTPPELFRQYMEHLKAEGFRVIAMRDLEPYIDRLHLPDDPLLKVRHPLPKDGQLALSQEMKATREDLGFWLPNMLVDHRYTVGEAAEVCAYTEAEIREKARELIKPGAAPGGGIRIRPYPGVRESRLASFNNIDAHRGTKASVFLPWDPVSYVVVDLPEAIFAGSELMYLVHTHIPTIWNDRNVVIENVDWTREAAGGLSFSRELPNKVSFGASIRVAGERDVAMEVWVRNGTAEMLKGLRAQICVLLKGAPEYTAQTNANKVFRAPGAAVQSVDGRRWILTAWSGGKRCWGNPPVPCLHSDPVLGDCAAGATVRSRGVLRFWDGEDAGAELDRLRGAVSG
jgi:peptidoglycan/xylan/chitin deacetylase (PgdA/CDA1 family)